MIPTMWRVIQNQERAFELFFSQGNVKENATGYSVYVVLPEPPQGVHRLYNPANEQTNEPSQR